MDLSDKYVFCKEASITSAMLFDKQEMLPVQMPKKGLILELYQVQTSAAVPWQKFTVWVYTLCGEPLPTERGQALRKLVLSLKTKRQYLQKSKTKREDLERFLNEPFIPPAHSTCSTSNPRPVTEKVSSQSRIERETIQFVNKSLAKEVVHLQEECTAQKAELSKKDEKIHTLEQQYKPHNVRRRMQRKDAKIAKQKECIDLQAKELKHRDQQEAKRAREQIRYYKQKCTQMLDQSESECEYCKDLEEELAKLKSENLELLEANAILKDELATLKSRKLVTYVDGKYTDRTRLCVMDILSHNVGINQVKPIIRAVLRLAEIECDELPKHTAISEMLLERHCLSQIQLAHTLMDTEYNTLHSDGTTKFGHKYCGYQISTAEKSLTLGLQVCACSMCACTFSVVIVTLHV